MMAPAQPAPALGTTFCTRCGSPVAPGSGFCAKCGAPVAPAAPPPTPTMYQAPAPPPAKKKHGALYWVALVLGIIVLVVIVIVAAGLLLYAAAPKVTVTAINFTSSDDACGTNSQTDLGFSTTGGSTYQESYIVTNSNFILSCTISSIGATTSGFSISGANVPLTIAAGGSQTLSFTIHVPSGSYNGVLTIDVE